MLDIRLLGQLRVMLDDRPVKLATRPAQLLLIHLVLQRETPQPREVVAELLWPASTSENARANLRHALWQLRAAVDGVAGSPTPYLVHTPHAIAFNCRSDYTLDVEILEREQPVWTTAALIDAAAAYHGELLPGFYESWIILERERLAVVFERRMSRLLDRLLEEGRWDDTLLWAERWITLDNAPEPAYRAMMRAYAALGDSSGVMVAYRHCRDALRTGLGVEPSQATQALVEQLTHGSQGLDAVR